MSTPTEGRIPPPLTVAASLAAVEALALVGYGVLELFSLSSQRLVMGLTTSLFLVGFGLFVGWAAWGLSRSASWARGPVVFTQLMQLGTAWSFRGGDTTVIAVALAVVAVIVLAGVLHPTSMAHLSDEE